MPKQPSHSSSHYLIRSDDGSVRLRIRFTPEEATLIEEGAGGTPVMLYIHRVITAAAKRHVRMRQEAEAAEAHRTADASSDEPASRENGGVIQQ